MLLPNRPGERYCHPALAQASRREATHKIYDKQSGHTPGASKGHAHTPPGASKDRAYGRRDRPCVWTVTDGRYSKFGVPSGL